MINETFTLGGRGVVPTKNGGEHRENDITLYYYFIICFPATLLYDCPPISILGGIHHRGVLIRKHTNYRFNIILTTHFSVGIGNNIYLFSLHNHTHTKNHTPYYRITPPS